MIRAGLLVLIVIFHTASGICRDGWTRFHGSCYLFVERPRENWQDAQNYCSAIKTHLVEIDDSEENTFLKSQIKLYNMNHNDCFWTGGNDKDKEGDWIWAYTKEPISSFYWTPGEPSSVNSTKIDEDCINMTIWGNLGWNDDYCTKLCSFVCEMEDEYYEVVG